MSAFPTSCSPQYILQQCQCLADPMDVYSTVCAYISKKNGLLYPCDPGCCKFSCQNKDPNISRKEVRPSTGTDPPPGFNVNLAHSDEPSEFPGMTSFVDPMPQSLKPNAPLIPPGKPLPDNPYPSTPLMPDAGPVAPEPPKLPLWKILLIAIIPFLLVVLVGVFL